MILALLAALTYGAAAPDEPKQPTFYNLTDDPSSLELLELDSIAGQGANTTAVIVNLFKGPNRFGNLSTWRVDCTRERMSIVRMMKFSPTSHGQDLKLNSELVNARATPVSWQMYNLICTGTGDLIERRTYYDQLPAIIHRFWQ